ncbi:MAG: hypothetical protein JWR47_2249 [Phenylobacterium sp.]|jgi:hypothetical protein|nr:hypothetical protein [Phenylobacterium sp.]MDB5461918.1 hypothetical protein [Phenylobacterium sp.]MDB5499452.1 hypothetical protein [Phenylobacterium sp.]
MAKSQKKSNKEIRKPKQPKAKPAETVSVLNPAHKKK